jgi:CelD/BcsL family acetyltransferase involved in cellulose biosynthesis
MTVHVISPGELTLSDLARWSDLQRSDPSLASPFLSAGFTQAVSSARSDVSIAVFEHEGLRAGFFPFQRGRLGVGRPVGWGLSDQQGVVAASVVSWTADDIMSGCGLKTLEFDHLLASQRPFEPFHHRLRTSPYMDLSQGLERYAAERRAAGVREMRTVERKLRKLEREHGTVTFVAHVPDADALASLFAWKSEQYLRTGASDVLAVRWVRRTLTAAHQAQTRPFAGLLSGLYVEGRLVAAHLGLRSESIWHWWFPSYDGAFGAYSPGLLLLWKMAEAAPSLGLRAIDLGKGDARYKQAFMSGATEVAEGAVETRLLAAGVARLRRRARSLARRSSLGPPARSAVRRLRRR